MNYLLGRECGESVWVGTHFSMLVSIFIKNQLINPAAVKGMQSGLSG